MPYELTGILSPVTPFEKQKHHLTSFGFPKGSYLKVMRTETGMILNSCLVIATALKQELVDR